MQHTIPTPVETLMRSVGSVDPYLSVDIIGAARRCCNNYSTGIRSSLSFPAREHTSVHSTTWRALIRRPEDIDRFIADWIARLIDPNHPLTSSSTQRTGWLPISTLRSAPIEWQAALLRTRPSLGRFSPLLALVAAYKDAALSRTTPCLWVEKTPLNEIHVHRFADFSEARFIQMVRERPKRKLLKHDASVARFAQFE